MKIENYLRHPFNIDQVDAIRRVFPDAEIGKPLKPFFDDASDFIAKVGGKTSSAVVPGDIFRDCWARQSFGSMYDDPSGSGIPVNTVIIGWRTDLEARKRGRFAVRGIVVHEWQKVIFSANCAGEPDCYGAIVMPVEIIRVDLVPTVESDFRTGEEFPYSS